MGAASALLLCLAASLIMCASAQAQQLPVVRIYVFSSPDCSHCQAVQPQNIKALADRAGCVVESRHFDIQEMANYGKLVALEEKYGDRDNEMPVVFIGREALGGEQEVQERLAALIAKYAAAGGTPWPDEVVFAPPTPATEVAPTVTPAQPPKSAGPMAAVEAPQAGQGSGAAAHKARPQPAAPPRSLPKRTPAKQNPTPPKPARVKAVIPQAARPVYLAFFYQTTCKECQRIFYLLSYLRQKYPNLVVREFDLAHPDNKALNETIAIRCRVPEKNRLLPATIFIGGDYLQGGDINQRNLEALIRKYSQRGTVCPWEIKREEKAAGVQAIVSRFKSLGPATVALAGLLDGINPCAFTTIIFFISYLTLVGKRGKEVLFVGLSFAVAVFLAYFLVGCGLLVSLERLTAFRQLSQVVNVVVALLAFVLAVVSLGDYFKARRGKFSEMGLQLPGPLKRWIHSTLRTGMKNSHYVMAAFVAGLIVSLLELACTGQVYLPTITFVVGQEKLRSAGLSYLLLYNLMFILPLLVVFLLAYRGTTSERLARFSKAHLAAVKLATAVLFLLLGLLVAFSISR